jgi:FkbM family methyltransferase
MIRTPLERPARALRAAAERLAVLRYPELRNLYNEERCLDAAIERCLRPGSNCIDVGAHIGSTLSTMVRLAPRGRHLAFEPIQEKALWLARKFPEVEVRAVALSDRVGPVEFLEDLSRPGFSGFRPAAGRRQRIRRHQVEAWTLDRALPPGYLPDFVKLDVEGEELAVLRGGRETFLRARPMVLFEHGPGTAAQSEDLFDLLSDVLGYDILKPSDFLDGGPPLSRAAFAATQTYPFQSFDFMGQPRPAGGAPPR